MSTIEIKAGRSVESALEGMSGGKEHRAILLGDLGSNLEAAAEEFGYTEAEPDAGIARSCKDLGEWLDVVSLTDEGELTLYRECSRCSGAGKTEGEDPCIDCGGDGAIHCDEGCQPRIWVNGPRTVLLTQYPDGSFSVALRDAEAHIWGPPIKVEPEGD